MRGFRVDAKALVAIVPIEVCVRGRLWKLPRVPGRLKGDRDGPWAGQVHHVTIAPCNEKSDTNSNGEVSCAKQVHLKVFRSTSTILRSVERSSFEGVGIGM